jgi:hypothetical protein
MVRPAKGSWKLRENPYFERAYCGKACAIGLVDRVMAGGAAMSLIGLLSSNLFAAGASQNLQNTQSTSAASRFQQIKTEFQELGEDLQSGNLSAAQQEYSTLSRNLPGASQTSSNPTGQAFNQLGKDLQAGNLQGAQQDYTAVQQGTQKNAAQVGGHRGLRHLISDLQDSASSQQGNPVAQALTELSQTLQLGNLTGAQSAFATLQNDLQQIGGFITGGPNGPSSSTLSSSTSGLNVTV